MFSPRGDSVTPSAARYGGNGPSGSTSGPSGSAARAARISANDVRVSAIRTRARARTSPSRLTGTDDRQPRYAAWGGRGGRRRPRRSPGPPRRPRRTAAPPRSSARRSPSAAPGTGRSSRTASTKRWKSGSTASSVDSRSRRASASRSRRTPPSRQTPRRNRLPLRRSFRRWSDILQPGALARADREPHARARCSPDRRCGCTAAPAPGRSCAGRRPAAAPRLRRSPRRPGSTRRRGRPRRRRRSARRSGAPRSADFPSAELLDATMGVEQARFEVQHHLADGREAEVPRLDDAGVDRPDRDLDDAVAVQAVERLHRRRDARRRRGRIEVLAQRVDASRPLLVQDQAARVRVPLGFQAQQVAHLALVPVRGRQDAASTMGTLAAPDRRPPRSRASRRRRRNVHQPEAASALAVVQADHRRQRRPEPSTEPPGTPPAAGDRNLDPLLARHVGGQDRRPRQRRRQRLGRRRVSRSMRSSNDPVPMVSAACRSSAFSPSGTHRPSTTTPTASGTSASSVVGDDLDGSSGRIGRPNATFTTWLHRPANVTASSARTSSPTQATPWRNAESRMPSSLRKMPDGGSPEIAKAPSRKSGPANGTARTAPRIRAIRRRAVPLDDVAGREEQQRLGDRVVQQVEQAREQRRPARRCRSPPRSARCARRSSRRAAASGRAGPG